MMDYLWLKALHLVFVVTWFAGLFYLPRLYVYHAMCDDQPGHDRFVIMERKLYRGIMTPSAVLTLLAGAGLIGQFGINWVIETAWIQLKLALVFMLILYHGYLGHIRKQFAAGSNQHSHVFYRWLNELPVLVLLAVVILAVVKPWS